MSRFGGIGPGVPGAAGMGPGMGSGMGAIPGATGGGLDAGGIGRTGVGMGAGIGTALGLPAYVAPAIDETSLDGTTSYSDGPFWRRSEDGFSPLGNSGEEPPDSGFAALQSSRLNSFTTPGAGAGAAAGLPAKPTFGGRSGLLP